MYRTFIEDNALSFQFLRLTRLNTQTVQIYNMTIEYAKFNSWKSYGEHDIYKLPR